MRILVNPRPQLSVNSSSVCAGDSATLTATGNANSYSWSPATGLSNTTGSSVKAAPGNTTVYTVTGTITTTGCQNTAQGTVSILPKPTITSISANPSTCGSSTGSITLNGLAASTTYTLAYSKNGVAVAPASRTSTTVGSIVISNLTAGVYENIIVTLNGCSSNTLGPITLSDPNPPTLTIPSSDVVVCGGNATGAINFSASTGATIS
jgi:hypothetical protein